MLSSSEFTYNRPVFRRACNEEMSPRARTLGDNFNGIVGWLPVQALLSQQSQVNADERAET